MSAELFASYGDIAEAAVSRALLALFHAEANPSLAVILLEDCLADLLPHHWLAKLSPEVLVLCKARHGDKALLREATSDEFAFDPDRLLSLHVLWCRLRTETILSPSRRAGLDILAKVFLERGLHDEAALAASDLAANFSRMSSSEHPLRALLADFDHLSSRPLASAIYHLVTAQEKGVPFDTAVLPLHASVSSIRRYPVHLIHVPSSEAMSNADEPPPSSLASST